MSLKIFFFMFSSQSNKLGQILNNFIATGSLESERGSFRSKSEGFGAEMNCGVRSKLDPMLSGSVGFGRLCNIRGEYWDLVSHGGLFVSR